MGGPRALRAGVRALPVAVAVVAIWTLAVVLSVRGDLQQARESLEQARAAEDLEQVDPLLARAERDLDRSLGRLHQPGPALVAAVPLLGRSLRVVDRTGQAALAVTRATRDVLAVTDTGAPLLRAGRLDLARLDEVGRALDRAATSTRRPVDRLREQPTGLVPGQVSDAAAAARRQLDTVPDDLARAAAGVRALRDLLGADGPRSLLLLLENNAELRGTGGLVSVFAEATARDGRLDIEGFRDVEDVFDPPGQTRRVAAPADFRRLYGEFLADTTLWKNTNMSPDVPTSSAVIAEVARATTGRAPDAVLWLDVPTIAAVLRATGPARLPDGSELRAEDAVERLLSQAYRDAPDTPAGQEQRRAVLRGAADAVLGDLLGSGSREVSPTSLARELYAAARGRHLALWSRTAEVQSELAAAGLDGAVQADDGDLSSVTVHNLGGGGPDGNKLDYYGRRQVTVEVQLDEDSAAVTQTVTLLNTAPDGLPAYVAGRGTPGVSNSFVTLALPRGAQDVAFSRGVRPLAVAALPEGDHLVVSDTVSLSPGASTTWELRYRLPLDGARYELAALPQPLAVDAGLRIDVRGPDGRVLVVRGASVGDDGTVVVSERFSASRRLRVDQEEPSRLVRLRRAVREFWDEPVRIG